MTPLSFFQRLPLAFSTLFRILFNGLYAAQVQALDSPPVATSMPASAAPIQPIVVAPPPPPPPPPAPPPPAAASVDSALQLLALFQREARFIDFTQENLSSYGDADIGAAARLVHAGCRKVLQEHFTLEAIRSEAEGSNVTLAAGFDANAVRLTGNVVGSAPFTGSLSHAGWRASKVNLPKLATGHDAHIIAPAEVEL